MYRHALLGIFGVLFGTLFSSTIALAAGWTTLTSPTTQTLNGIDCGTASACVAVGDSGTVLYTADKVTWAVGTSGTTETLHAVDMVSATIGFAVGNSGVILKTTNGGATWSALTSGTTEQLWDIVMASTTVGWAAGEDLKIVKTTDGGTTWTSVGGVGGDFRAIDASSTTNVWAAGKNGVVVRSTDGGTTWTLVPYPTSATIYALNVTSTTTALLGGANALLGKTTNSGSSWTALTPPAELATTATIMDLAFWSSSHGNLVSDDGTIAATASAGTTWTSDTTVYSTTPAYTDEATPSTGVRYLVGASGFLALYDNYGPSAPTDLTVDGDATDDDYSNTATPTLTWDNDVTDEEGSAVDYFEYSVDGGAYATTSSTSSQTLSALTPGTHTVDVRAVDLAGNAGDDGTLTFIIDTEGPVLGTVSPTATTAGTSTTYRISASDPVSGIDNCALYRNATAVGVMTESGSYWVVDIITSTAGTYALYAVCYDFAGNSTTSTTSSLSVTGTSSSTVDSTAPTVGSATPTTATKDAAQTLTVTVSDGVGVASCSLYVNGSNVGSMTLSGTTASKSYTFASTGTYTVYATCVDTSGNVGTGSSASVTVSAASTSTDSEEDLLVAEAQPGDLMKMACDDGADVNDPCKAVYFFGVDAHRHAFPNEKVYFTWYSNFDDVVIVSDDFMASVMLGRNVTYRPGSRLVKFITVNTVYAVDTDGTLRPIASEDVAKSIWGAAWAKEVDDISDAFYSNYRFGASIESTSDFDPDEVIISVESIEDIL